ncbi:MAG TPA: hypothetical protein VFE15_16980 [Marmoricola sp.]|nr:hypothetical protein [Marmoricola sp.]
MPQRAYRLVAVGGAVAAALAFTTASVTAAVAPPSATLGPATCVGRDGQVQLTLNAGGADADFTVYFNGVYFNEYLVPAAASQVVTFSGLSDSEQDFQARSNGPGSPEGGTILVDESRFPACDNAPLPYTDAKGSMAKAGCSAVAVAASNAVVPADGPDLQPVTFVLSAQSLSGGASTQLASFVLNASTPTYSHTVKLADLSGPSKITLTAGGKTLATSDLRNGCSVTVKTPHHSAQAVAALPDTGA